MHLDKLMSRRFEPVEQEVTARDCMLYALGLGLGSNPADPAQLQYVYEQDLQVFPSMSVVIAHPGLWFTDPGLGINWLKLLHGEQSFSVHAPMRPDRVYVGEFSVLGVVDKGADKGAVMYQEKILYDKGTGDKIATVNSAYFMRADGGCGSTGYQPPAPDAAPDGPAQQSINIGTLPQAALIYRLSGDYNPIHADPKAAAGAGFERPILHGLCSLGVATRGLLETCCAADPTRLSGLSLRFSAPVYPGETLRVDVWPESGQAHFEAAVIERDVKVLKQGLARLN